MDPVPIKNAEDAIVEETIDQPKLHQETEAFAFKLPPGFEQQIGMLGSVLQNNAGVFEQLIKKPKDDRASNDSSTKSDSQQKPEQIKSDMNKIFEQSVGMINSVFKDHGSDVLGKFFGQPQKKQEEPVYPRLDLEDDKPKSKLEQGTVNIEGLLTQGFDKLGINLQDNSGDILGQIFGQPKKSSEPEKIYPKLDDLEFNKPQPKPKSEQLTSPTNIETVINQGIDVIGSAIKGNAGNILTSFLKNSIAKNSSDKAYVPEKKHEPIKEQKFPDDNVTESLKVYEKKPEFINEQKSQEHDVIVQPKDSEPEQEKKGNNSDEKILDYIPDDAFEEAFDAIIGKSK